MRRTIVALPGDGIGKEVVAAALLVLRECASLYKLEIEIEEYPVGGEALQKHGEPLPAFVLAASKKAGTVLLGAVGEARYEKNASHLRPEWALLQLRKELGLFANLRPVKTYEPLLDASPLKRALVEGVDLLIVRELTGGIYFGQPRGSEQRPEGRVAFDPEIYHDYEVERIARVAFEASRERRRKVTSVDKANVLESSRLWRTVVEEVGAGFRDVELRHLLVDNCAMQLIAAPRSFDVLVTTNLFGDILSDEAAMLTGSIGMLPSASLGPAGEKGRMGMYEPVHGTAPDIAGQDQANPLATIASLAMLFRYSLEREDIAQRIERSIETTLDQGYRTADLASGTSDKIVGTRAMTEQVLAAL